MIIPKQKKLPVSVLYYVSLLKMKCLLKKTIHEKYPNYKGICFFIYISSLHLCSWIKAVIDCWWCMWHFMSHICAPTDGMAGKYCGWMANTGVEKKACSVCGNIVTLSELGWKKNSCHVIIHMMTAITPPFIWHLSHHHSWYDDSCHIAIHIMTAVVSPFMMTAVTSPFMI